MTSRTTTTMQKNKKKVLRRGKGGKCSVLLRMLHPQKVRNECFENRTFAQRESFVMVRMDSKIIRGTATECIVLSHDGFDGVEFYCTQRFVTVTEEGLEEHIFANNSDGEYTRQTDEQETNEGAPIADSIFHSQNTSEDISLVRAQGLMVDDDNDPAPENIPNENNTNIEKNKQTWGWLGLDNRRVAGIDVDVEPTLRKVKTSELFDISYASLFVKFFGEDFLDDVILKGTNENMEGRFEITKGELLRYLGLWLLIATYGGCFRRRDFFASTPVSERHGAPIRLNQYMSGRRFEAITVALTLTNEKAPTFNDDFWEVRQMIEQWNNNMSKLFVSSWVTCLDESMSIWNNRWTCPGWVFCPRKPHPFGNEYHTICCGLSGVLFKLEMVEGKQRPKELQKDPPNKRTIGLLLRLCKDLYHRGKVVILDSGFCVLDGLIELRKKGVYSGTYFV